MKIPTPEQTHRFLIALGDAVELADKRRGSYVSERINVEHVIEMIDKYPQIVNYAAEFLTALDSPGGNNEMVRMMLAAQAFATLAKEILELDDERPRP